MWFKTSYVRVGLHIIVTILVTAKVLVWNASKASYVRSIQQSFEFIFTDLVLDYPVEAHRVDLFSYNDSATFVDKLLDRYHVMNNLSTSEFAYGTELFDGSRKCVDNALPVLWTSCLWESPSTVNCQESFVDSKLEMPITNGNVYDFYHQLDSFNLQFDLCNYVNTFRTNHDCHYWRVRVTFRSVSFMYLQATVSSTLIDECEQSQSSISFAKRPSNWLNIFSLIFCLVYIAYVIYDIFESIRIYRAVRAAHERAHAAYLNKRPGESVEHEAAAAYSWKDIPRGVKRSFHNYWSLFTFIAVFLAILQAGISLSDPYDDLENLEKGQKALVGLSIFGLWMTTVQFIPAISPVYAFAATIQTAFPRIFAFLLSFIPVFLAFVFFGIALFGTELGAFDSVDRAAKFIFALMAGDSVMQIMQLVCDFVATSSVFHLTCINNCDVDDKAINLGFLNIRSVIHFGYGVFAN